MYVLCMFGSMYVCGARMYVCVECTECVVCMCSMYVLCVSMPQKDVSARYYECLHPPFWPSSNFHMKDMEIPNVFPSNHVYK